MLDKFDIVQDLPFQRKVDGLAFPLVIKPKQDQKWPIDVFQAYLTANRQQIRRLINLHGAVLFRGFVEALQSPVEFNDIVNEALGFESLPYVGGAAVRNQVYKGAFTSNESPPDQKIPYHHEMAQSPVYPSYIFFYSQICAQQGGETPILRSDELYSQLNVEFTRRLQQKGLRYVRVMPEFDDPTSAIGRGWRATYNVTVSGDMEADKQKCQQVATSLKQTIEWLPNGDLRTSTSVLDGVKFYKKPFSAENEQELNQVGIFFNSMIAAYLGWKDTRNDPLTAIRYGDGSQVDDADMQAAVNVMRRVEVVFKWEPQDLLCIDNHLVMHSRSPFVAPRRVLAFVAK